MILLQKVVCLIVYLWVGELQGRVSEVEISPELESFIAPAILPRTFINLQVRSGCSRFLASYNIEALQNT